MNEIRRPLREADELEQFRSIIDRHALPPYTTGFKLRIGEFNDFPALWVSFVLSKDISPDDDEDDVNAQLDATSSAVDAIRDDLLTERPDRFPYFTFEVAQPAKI